MFNKSFNENDLIYYSIKWDNTAEIADQHVICSLQNTNMPQWKKMMFEVMYQFVNDCFCFDVFWPKV